MLGLRNVEHRCHPVVPLSRLSKDSGPRWSVAVVYHKVTTYRVGTLIYNKTYYVSFSLHQSILFTLPFFQRQASNLKEERTPPEARTTQTHRLVRVLADDLHHLPTSGGDTWGTCGTERGHFRAPGRAWPVGAPRFARNNEVLEFPHSQST